MIRIFAALSVAALAGCVASSPDRHALLTEPGRMSSAVLFDPARFSGAWQVVLSGVEHCAGARQQWRFDGQNTFVLDGVDCASTQPAVLSGRAIVTGPGGRMRASGGAYADAPVWVLWVDQDYRIAVLGTPEGHFGVVLAREGMTGRGDLIAAAREVLAFNGYDSGLMRE